MSYQGDDNLPGEEGAEGGQAPNEDRRNDEYRILRQEEFISIFEGARVYPENHPLVATAENLNRPINLHRVYLTDQPMTNPESKAEVQNESLHRPMEQEGPQQDTGEHPIPTDPIEPQEQQPRPNLRSRMKKQLNKFGFGSSRSHGESSRKSDEDEPPPSTKQ